MEKEGKLYDSAQSARFQNGINNRSFKAIFIQTIMLAKSDEIEPYVAIQEDMTKFVPALAIVSQNFPAKPAQPAEGSTAAVRDRYKEELKEWRKLSAAQASLATFMTGAISEGLARTIFPGGDIETQTAFEILKALKKEFTVMDVSTKDKKLGKLKEKFDPETTSLEEHRAKFFKFIEELQEGGYAITEAMKLEYLEESISNTEGDWIVHNELKPTFRTTYVTIESQTIEKLFAMLISYEKSSKKKTTAGDMFAGAARTTTAAKADRCYTEAEWRKMAKDEAEKNRKNRRGGGGGGGGGASNSRDGGQGRDRRGNGDGGRQEHGEYGCFCSTHGYNHTHNSTECRYRSRDHNDTESPAQRTTRLPNDSRNNKYY